MIRSRQGKLGLAAVAAVALAAAGAAFAASRMHGSNSSARAAFGPGAFARGYGPMSPGLPGRGLGDRRGPFGDLQTVTDYLGISQADLFEQLRAGKTLAQVAASTSGKSAAGLVDALVASEQDRLAQAVKDGRLTQSQADRLGADLKSRITGIVNGTGFGFRGARRPAVPPTHI